MLSFLKGLLWDRNQVVAGGLSVFELSVYVSASNHPKPECSGRFSVLESSDKSEFIEVFTSNQFRQRSFKSSLEMKILLQSRF